MMFALNRPLLILCMFATGAVDPVVANAASSRSKLDSSFDIRYGTVVEVEQTKLKTQAGQGAVFGGIAGAVAGHGHHGQGRDAVIGAVAGALITRMLEKKHAFGYTVNLQSGGTVKVVVDHGDIRSGDCVAVEQGRTANVRRVSTSYCEHHGDEAFDDHDVYASGQNDASACHHAKELALDSTTDDELERAMKKVHAFCSS